MSTDTGNPAQRQAPGRVRDAGSPYLRGAMALEPAPHPVNPTPTAMLSTIAFDADDTLWHNETLFSVTQAQFREILQRYVGDADIDARLYETEVRNLRLFGYGIKGFTLSMIETAIDVSGQQIAAHDIRRLIDFGKAMLEHPVELLDGVEAVIAALKGRFRLMVITKGDLFDQESKIARSGLADHFDAVEIVAEKDEATYRQIFERHALAADTVLMVGNSVRSDILPVTALGVRAVHIPYHVTWAHEQAGGDRPLPPGAHRLERIADLPALVDKLVSGAS